MRFSIKVENHIDAERLAYKLENDRNFNLYQAMTWHKLIQPWIPMRTGNLCENVAFSPKGEIKYNAPYARHVYYGDNKNFNKTYHPLASARWDEAARPSQESKLIDALQNYIDSGRLDLNE